MIIRKSRLTNTGSTEYRAEKEGTVPPEEKRRYTDEDGDTWVETTCGRLFKADVFDHNFKITRGEVLPKGSREAKGSAIGLKYGIKL